MNHLPGRRFTWNIKPYFLQSYVIIVHFWAKSFKTFHEILCSRIFPCLILPYNRSRSIQGHHLNYLVSTLVPDATCKVSWPLVNWFWRKSFKGFYHIWAWWPYWSCDLDSLNIFLFSPNLTWSRSTQAHNLNNLGSTCIDNVTYHVSRSSVYWFWRRRFFKVFTIYGHGGHVGHVTQLICINFHSNSPLSFHMSLGSKSPNCFCEKVLTLKSE